MAYQRPKAYDYLFNDEKPMYSPPSDSGFSWKGVGDFFGGLVKSIPEVGGSLARVVGDLPYHVENAVYGTDAGLRYGENWLQNQLQNNGDEDMFDRIMREDKAYQNSLDLLSQEKSPASIVNLFTPDKRIFNKSGTDLSNAAIDVSKDNKYVGNSLGLLFRDDNYKNDEGYASDAFNILSTLMPVGKAAKLLPGAGKILPKLVGEGAEQTAKQAFIKGLLEEGGSQGIKNILSNVGGRATSGAAQGALGSIFSQTDKGNDIDWSQAGTNALLGGLLGGGFAGAGYGVSKLKPELNAKSGQGNVEQDLIQKIQSGELADMPASRPLDPIAKPEVQSLTSNSNILPEINTIKTADTTIPNNGLKQLDELVGEPLPKQAKPTDLFLEKIGQDVEPATVKTGIDGIAQIKNTDAKITGDLDNLVKLKDTDAPTARLTGDLPNVNVDERKFATTLKESVNTTTALKDDLAAKDFSYQKITNKDTIESAQAQINSDEVLAMQKVFTTKSPTAETNVIGQLLIQKYQKSGEFDKASSIAEDLITKATSQGQAIQALSVWDRLSPEGVLLYTQKQAKKNKIKNPIPVEKIQVITELAQKAELLPEGSAARQKAKLDVLKEVSDVTQTNFQKFKKYMTDYRYANILSSPNTHINNAFGNSIQAGFLNPATKFATGAVDAIASKLTGKERTAYISEVPVYYRGLFGSIGTAIKEVGNVFTGENLSSSLDRGLATGKASGVIGNTLYGKYSPFALVSKSLEASDVFFRTIIESGEREALALRFKKLGKVVDPVEIERIAKEKADYFTFKKALDPSNDTGQGALLASIDKITAGVQKMKQNPVVGWFVPFVQTPMNIFKQGIEYSPLGLANLVGADNKSEQIAKALVGSTVMATAGYVVMSSDSTWAAPTSPKERDAFYASGRQPYSIKVGDKWVAFDKLGPIAYPIAMAAAWKYNSQQSKNSYTNSQFDNFTGTLAEVGKFFSDQSYVKSVGDLVALAQGDPYAASRLGSNIPGQYVPLSSLIAWAARATDPVRRDPQNVGEQLMARIPFLSKEVQAMKDENGKELERSDNIANLFSPLKLSDADDNQMGNKKYDVQQVRNIDNKIADIKKKANAGEIDATTAKADVAKLEQSRREVNQNISSKYGTGVSANANAKQASAALGIKEMPKEKSLEVFKTKKVSSKKVRVKKPRKAKIAKYKTKKIKTKFAKKKYKNKYA